VHGKLSDGTDAVPVVEEPMRHARELAELEFMQIVMAVFGTVVAVT
jgi:hypothetical protein